MGNERILNQIVNEKERRVFKGMKIDMESGKALLQPEQLGQFLRYATLPNVILADADFKLMQSFKKILNNVSIEGQVLQNGYTEEGETNPDLKVAKPKFGYNELDAKKLKAVTQIEDEEKEDNMTQAGFEQTLLQMMGERIGEDIEFWGIFADTEVPRETNSLLNTTDGWIKKSGIKLESKGKASSGKGDFDLENTVEAMFDAMLYKMPPRFRQQRSNLKYYVPFEVEDAYRNLEKSRHTVYGDGVQTGFPTLNYKGIPVVHCPTLDNENGRAIDNTATSFLTNPKNLAYGIWKNLAIEPERKPGLELTKYWYRMRGDVGYYFNEATVTAKITAEEVAGIAEAHKM